MRKIYVGILLICFWVQKNTTARRGKGWWYWSARGGKRGREVFRTALTLWFVRANYYGE